MRPHPSRLSGRVIHCLTLPTELQRQTFQLDSGARAVLSKQWDPHYTEIFSANDPGEPPLIGGLLVAQHGKGNTSTSMAGIVELRAGVPELIACCEYDFR